MLLWIQKKKKKKIEEKGNKRKKVDLNEIPDGNESELLDQDWDFISDVTTVQDPILATVPTGIVSFVFSRKKEATDEEKQLNRLKDQELLMSDDSSELPQKNDDDEEAYLEWNHCASANVSYKLN